MSLELLDFLDMCEAFIEETNFGLTYDEDIAIGTYMAIKDDPNTEILYVMEEGVVAGAAVVSLDYFAHAQPFGYIVRFYVYPEFRGVFVPLKLIDLCNAWFNDKGTVQDYVSLNSGINDNVSAIKLFESAGYNNYANLLYREKRNGVSKTKVA